jgi:hypothetical protein
MKPSRLLTLAASPFLFLLEYIFKFAAGVTSIIVLGAQGSFFGKVGTGFGSLIDVLYQIIAWFERLSYIGTVIRDYNTLTASAFNERYGGQAINRVMESLNEAVTYFQIVYQNLSNQPFATLTATLMVFLFFYFFARTSRFLRQRGKGSYLVRKEREIGDRIFRDQEK